MPRIKTFRFDVDKGMEVLCNVDYTCTCIAIMDMKPPYNINVTELVLFCAMSYSEVHIFKNIYG